MPTFGTPNATFVQYNQMISPTTSGRLEDSETYNCYYAKIGKNVIETVT